MKKNLSMFFILHPLSFILATAAPLELRWRAEASDPKPYSASVYRGETVALSASLYAYNAPVALAPASACTLYWQTNGMGSAWWSAPGAASTNGTLSAVWSPTNDVGAALYSFFLSAETPSGRIYRASGTIRMLGSPGAEPGAMPLPVQSIDFAAVTALNAPWVSGEDWRAGSNALASALQPLGPRLDLLESGTSRWDAAYAWGDWHYAVALKLDAADTNGWETGSHASFLTSAPPQSVVSVNGQTGAVSITAQSLGALTNVPQPYTVRDSTDTNRWWRFEGTQAVQYTLGPLATNYTVTLSADFMETVGGTRPEWTNNVFPFTDGVWIGFFLQFVEDVPFITGYAPGGAEWENVPITAYPKTLSPTELTTAQGTATIYQHIYYPTNATGNVLGPVPTNLVTYAQLLAWWVETGAVYATTQHVAQAIAAIPVPDLSSRVAVQSGHATNLAVSGWLALPQSQPTNLVLRLVSSNEHIIVQEVYQ